MTTPSTPACRTRLVVTASPELHLKSRRSRKRLMQTLAQRVRAAAGTDGDAAVRRGPGDRFTVTVDAAGASAVAQRLASLFGVGRVDETHPVATAPLHRLCADVTAYYGPRLGEQSFGVRVRRRGAAVDWSAPEAERTIGRALLDAAPHATVDLDDPDVWVRVEVVDGIGWLSTARYDGPRGMPLGSGTPMLALLSGGIDSPVAAWLMMRSGSPVHFVHFSLGCAGIDHAAAVASGLVHRWGTGASPRLVVVDFEPVADALVARADPALRQIHLKQAMLSAAEVVARRHSVSVLVTGDSVAQVSSQTATNLSLIDRATDLLVLRPLAGMNKDEISARAREIGTFDISARAVERCDLSDGPVAVEARRERVARGWESFDRSIVDAAVEGARRIDLRNWMPGDAGLPAWRNRARADTPG